MIIGLFLQNVLGYTAYEAGIIFLAMTVAMGALSPYGGKMSDMMDPRIPICGGLALVTVSLIVAGFMTHETSLYMVIPVLLMVGVGHGTCLPGTECHHDEDRGSFHLKYGFGYIHHVHLRL